MREATEFLGRGANSPTDGDGVLHEAPVDDATQQLPADGHLADEWALLVDVLAALGLLRDLEAEANALDLARALARGARKEAGLAGEDVRLLLVRPLCLRARCTTVSLGSALTAWPCMAGSRKYQPAPFTTHNHPDPARALHDPCYAPERPWLCECRLPPPADRRIYESQRRFIATRPT